MTKIGKIVIETSVNGPRTKTTNYIFYSYDKGSAALDFWLKNQKGEMITLTNTTARFLFVGIQDGEKGKFIYLDTQPNIDKPEKGRILYYLPEELLMYEGELKGYLYLDFEDGSHSDELSFTFAVVRSKIDSEIEEVSEVYIKDFEQVKREVFEIAEKEKQKIEIIRSELEMSVTELNEQIQNINKMIGENELLTKEQFSVVLSQEISKLENIKSDKKMYVRRTKDTIEIISKYNQKNDLLFTFGIVSKNRTWQISNSYLLRNDDRYPSSDFLRSKTLLNKVFTDYVAPYHQLRALQNIDGDKPNSGDYTGGWHAYNNDSSGGVENTPTSSVESLKIFVDNVEIDFLDRIIGGNEIKIITTNLVQGTNTKKADGSGRAILREKVIYIIIGGKIQVEVELTALEPLTMKDYYFLQASNSSSYSKTLLPVDDNRYFKSITEFKENIYGGVKGESHCSQLILTDNANQLVIGIDRDFGLGRYQYNQGKSVWFYRNYGKVYFNPIASDSSATITLEEGEKLFARGFYLFSPKF